MPLLIEENYTAALSELLKEGVLDVIMISLPFEAPGIVTQALYDEPFVVVTPAAHPWKKQKTVKASELAGENLLLLGPGHCSRDQVLKACPGLNRSSAVGSLQRTLEGGSLETIRHMVASGTGVTVLPCSSVYVHPQENKLLNVRPFSGAAPKRRIALAWRDSFPRPEAVKVLREAVHACALRCVTRVGAARSAARQARDGLAGVDK